MSTPVASDLEELVYNWLTRRGIPFRFQTSLMGGYYQLGGSVVDFIVEPNLAWRVQGEYFHEGVTKKGSDMIQREMLMGLGYVVVDLYADDLIERIDETLRKAMLGEEMLR